MNTQEKYTHTYVNSMARWILTRILSQNESRESTLSLVFANVIILVHKLLLGNFHVCVFRKTSGEQEKRNEMLILLDCWKGHNKFLTTSFLAFAF